MTRFTPLHPSIHPNGVHALGVAGYDDRGREVWRVECGEAAEWCP